MDKDTVKHWLTNNTELNRGKLQDWKNEYLPKFRNEYRKIILKNLEKYTYLPTDITKNIIAKYLISNCDCCHTLICANLYPMMKKINVRFIIRKFKIST